MQKPWSLYNKEDKLRVDDLTLEQVRIVLLATSSARMDHWYACQEGDVHWQPIAAIPDFYEDVRQIKGVKDEEDRNKEVSLTQSATHSIVQPAVQPAVELRPLFEDPPDEKTEPTLQVDFTGTKERRSARRYPRVVGFKVTDADQTFQCSTVDISMAGISLDQPLPSWVPKVFSAELSLKKHSIKVMCSKVSEQKLKLQDSSSWDVIRAWIVNG